MNKLVIYTRFPCTVAALLKTHELVEKLMPVEATEDLEVAYPDDAISQALAFWFALAKGCGLISGYKLLTPWMIAEEAARKRALLELERKPAINRHRFIFGIDPATGEEAAYWHTEGANLVEARWMCQACGKSFRKQIDAECLVWLADNPREMKRVCAACHKRLTREKKIIREAK